MNLKEAVPAFIQTHQKDILRVLDISTVAFVGFTVYASVLGHPALLPGIGAGASGLLRYRLEKKLQEKAAPKQ